MGPSQTPSEDIYFTSSKQKKLVRRHFDRPLLEQFKQQSSGDRPLHYFGLAGPHAEDIEDWQDLLGHVTNVDSDEGALETFEHTLLTRHPNISGKPIYGDLDQVILSGQSRERSHGAFVEPTLVSDRFEPTTKTRYWSHNLLNLDYFGPFLPDEEDDGRSIGDRVNARTSAWIRLFQMDRVDAYHPWMLMITFDPIHSTALEPQLRSWVGSAAAGHGKQVQVVVDAVVGASGPREEVSARLMHAVVGLYVEQCTPPNLSWKPRGSVLYLGGKNNDRPMAHMAFEFYPSKATPIPASSSRPLDGVSAPLLRVVGDQQPHFQLAGEPWSRATVEKMGVLDFLDPEAWA